MFLHGYPATLSWLAGHLTEADRERLRPRLVTTDSEMVTTDMRARISEGFRARVVDFYDSHEFNMIARECVASGLYHVSDASVIVEVLRNGRPVGPHEEGELAGTALHSWAMPFIRYRLRIAATRAGKLHNGRSRTPALPHLLPRFDGKFLRRICRVGCKSLISRPDHNIPPAMERLSAPGKGAGLAQKYLQVAAKGRAFCAIFRAVDRKKKITDCLWIGSGWALAAVLLRPFQDLPFIDDWTYAWSVEHLLKTGELRILDWSASPNFVQVLWGALFCLPFGFSFSALRASTFVLTVCGLWSFYLLLRALGLGRREALIGTATLALNPVFFVLSWTFMTDVPFLAVMIASSLAMTGALRRRSIAWLMAAEVLGCLGLGIRLVGLSIFAGIAASLILCDGIGKRSREVLIAIAVPILFVAALLGWTLNHTEHIADMLVVDTSPANRFRLLRYAIPLLPKFSFAVIVAVTSFLGEALLPLTLASVTYALLSRAALFGGILAACFTVTYAVGAPLLIPLSADSTWALTELGATAQLVPDFQPPTLPSWLPWGLSGIAIASFSIFLVRISTLRRLNSGVIFITCLAAAHLLLIAILWLRYDRYLLVLLPLGIALLLYATPNIRMAPAAVLLIPFGVVSTVGLRDHLSYNRALWRGVAVLRNLGARDSEIDGGYMVDGWLQYAHPENAPRDAQGKVSVPWVNDRHSLRYRISNQPLQGWRVVAALPYSWWLGRSGKIYVLENPDASVLSPRSQ